MKEIVGILLAAGSSRRFGSDKRLHPLADGTPMALASARRLAEVCGPTLVVIRPGDKTLADMLAAEGMQPVICDTADKGMGNSLSCGVAASAEAHGWLVALADMPHIESASYLAVLGALQNSSSLARPVYQGKMGHPVGFKAKYLPELLALTGDRGARAILDAHRKNLHLCHVEDPGILHDIDQPSQVIATQGYSAPLFASELPFST